MSLMDLGVYEGQGVFTRSCSGDEGWAVAGVISKASCTSVVEAGHPLSLVTFVCDLGSLIAWWHSQKTRGKGVHESFKK